MNKRLAWLTIALVWLLLAAPAAAELSAAELFEATWELVEERFYRSLSSELDLDSLRRQTLKAESPVASINEGLEKLQASHTRLFHRSEPAYFELLDVFAYGPQKDDIRALFGGELPRYEGILAVFEQGEVRALVPGGPAATAGLRLGDRVEAAEGQPFHPLRSFQGRASAEVQLSVQRSGKKLELSVVPEWIQPREAFLRSIDASVRVINKPPYRLGYVRVWSYAGEVYHRRLVEVLKTRFADVDALVLDLRGSWGGAQPSYVEAFTPVLGLKMQPRAGEGFSMEGAGWDRPLAVLVDRSVSSGKELLALAVSRSGRGLLIGETTRGAVLGGGLHLLGEEHALYLAEFDVTVAGQRLEGVGVPPDHRLPREVFVENGLDRLPDMGASLLVRDMLSKELVRRGALDQAVRFRQSARMSQVDRENTAFLKKVVDELGWPRRSVVGRPASEAAWLILQHSSDRDFQQRSLELLRQAVAEDEARAVNLAYLEDRVRVRQGLPQLYGTQLREVDGKMEFFPFDDLEKVKARRAELGLPSLEEYLQQVREMMDSFEN